MVEICFGGNVSTAGAIPWCLCYIFRGGLVACDVNLAVSEVTVIWAAGLLTTFSCGARATVGGGNAPLG